MANLTTLAPDIVAAILDDSRPNHITLLDLAHSLSGASSNPKRNRTRVRCHTR